MIQYNVPNINSIYYFILQTNILVGKKCKPYKNTNMNKCAQRFKCFLSLTVVYTFSESFTEPCNDPIQNTSLQCISLQRVTNTTSKCKST